MNCVLEDKQCKSLWFFHYGPKQRGAAYYSIVACIVLYREKRNRSGKPECGGVLFLSPPPPLMLSLPVVHCRWTQRAFRLCDNNFKPVWTCLGVWDCFQTRSGRVSKLLRFNKTFAWAKVVFIILQLYLGKHNHSIRPPLSPNSLCVCSFFHPFHLDG